MSFHSPNRIFPGLKSCQFGKGSIHGIFPLGIAPYISNLRTFCLTLRKSLKFSPLLSYRFHSFTFHIYIHDLFWGNFCIKEWGSSCGSSDGQLLLHHLLNFPPLDCLCIFTKNQLSIFVWICLWVLCSAALICVSSLLNHCLHYWSNIVSTSGRGVPFLHSSFSQLSSYPGAGTFLHKILE